MASIKVACVSLPIAALLVVTGCGSGNSGGGGSTINVGIGGDPSGLDPQLYEDQNAQNVYGNIFEALIFRDAKTNALEPGLATSWKQTDPQTERVTLRKNVKFTDGEPFDADAVVYSIKRITNKNFKTQQADYFGTINDAVKVNDNTVDIKSSAPDPIIPQQLALVTMVPPKYIQQHGASFFNSHPVGTGPYVFKSWDRGSKVVLTANGDYWGGKPKIDTANFLVMADPNTQLNAVKTGSLDLATNLGPQQMEQAPKKISIVGANHPMIILNQRTGPFTNKLVRLAANYAVDLDTIASKVYAGEATVATCQPFGPQTLGFDPSLKRYPYDPAKAKQLLAQAGNPHPSVTFIGESGRWIDDGPAEQAVQGYLEAVGFKVKYQSLPFAQYLQQLIPAGNNPSKSRPDMLWTSTGDVTGDADQKIQTFYAKNAPAGSLNDPAMYSLVDTESTTIDRAARTTAQHAVLARGCDQAEFIFLVAQKDLYGLSKRLTWQPRYDENIEIFGASLS